MDNTACAILYSGAWCGGYFLRSRAKAFFRLIGHFIEQISVNLPRPIASYLRLRVWWGGGYISCRKIFVQQDYGSRLFSLQPNNLQFAVNGYGKNAA